ncbi:Glucooligosaccharide oxidase [Sphaerobolus stellatus SS14]|uniref:Glucooligosaccharide oxidase n=1 Tax=Sphaerobolus stellatus (strain SS14) TaxID=990650 RepID=A0A0C9V7G1_SPHS4|nr:Glucooligosaccharide oxidase [Sphaerobolus stellatus SS14]
MLTKLLLLPCLLGPVFADQAPLRIPSWKEGKDLNAALSCVQSISGLQFTTPGDPEYTTKAAPFNLRMSPRPSLIVSPISVAQISETVQCAYTNGGTVSAKSGGHSYAAYGLSADIVIEMAGLNNITVDNADQTALVQTGNRLGNVAKALYEHGQRALPHGSCPYVGSGGHTLYGGFGYYSRIGGLMADVVISAEVVLADGRVVNASATNSYSDLFYAIRGGGPSFGVVTTWKFQTLEAATTTVSYFITFRRSLSAEAAANAYLIWQRICGPFPEPSDNLATAVVFSPAEEEGTVHMRFQGNWYGPEEDAYAWLDPFMHNLQAVGLNPILNATAHNWIDGLRAFAGNGDSLDTSEPDIPDNFFTKSLITMNASPAWLIRNWVNYMATEGVRSNTDWFAQVDLYGGKIGRLSQDTNAFAYRDAFLVYQLYASKPKASSFFPPDGIPFVNGMLAALEPNPAGAYPNYIDPTLGTSNKTGISEWQRLYYRNEANINKLQDTKAKYDAMDVFKNPQGF